MEEKPLILVIDDAPLMRAATVRVLDQAGYRTCQAADGLAGLQMTRDQKPDLTLLDVNLPDISGLEVCRLIKTDPTLLGCFVVLLSAERIDTQSQADGLDGGADGYIARPISNVELLARVQSMLRIQQSDAALRESEAKLKKTQQYAHMGSWTWNIKANHLDWSDEMFHIFGLEKDTFTGSLETVIANAIHPDDRKKLDKSNLLVTQDKQPVPLEYRVIWPDKSVHTVWAEAGEFKLDEAGNPESISGYVLDITERKQAEETLRENEKKLRMIFETMSEGIALNEIVFNESGEMIDYRILDVNQAFYSTADYSGQVVAGNVASVLYGMSPEIIKAFWETHRTRKEVQHTEMLSPLNNKWFYISTSPFINNRFVTSFFDITERKKAEQDLAKSHEQLRQINVRLVEVEEAERKALSKELHDRVGQSLTALNINLGLIRSNLEKESPQKLTARFDTASELVTEITDHIRGVMAELHPPVLDDYGLTAALRWYAERLKQQTGLDVEVSGNMIEPRLPISISITLFRIAQEALTNIIKHANASLATIDVETQADSLTMSIIDNGIGFDVIRSAVDGKVHWGLVTMRERAETLNGKLEIESVPGEGTKLLISIPR